MTGTFFRSLVLLILLVIVISGAAYRTGWNQGRAALEREIVQRMTDPHRDLPSEIQKGLNP